jgi:hypothetical protein
MNKKSFFLIFFVIVCLLFLEKTYAVDSARTITSPHFIILYDISESSIAIQSASDLESFHDTISGFLEADPLEKFHVKISGNFGITIPAGGFYREQSILHINPGADYNRTKVELYDNLFIIFLSKLVHAKTIGSVLEKNLISALKQHPVTSREIQSIKFSDLVNIEDISSINLNNISKFHPEQQQIIYSAFIDFIISSYGKKILVQSLKDTVYYGGFFKSVSMITGKTAADIETGFNSWLKQFKSGSRLNAGTKIEAVHLKDEFNDTSFSISEDGQTAILQVKNTKFRILIKNGSSEMIIPLEKTESDNSFNELLFINNNRLAVVEILKSGSKILIYDILRGEFVKTIIFPYLFINEVKCSGIEKMIFSARCGSKSDIYTYDIKSEEFNIITDSGKNYSPLLLNDKAYFVSVTDKSSITELNIITGESKSIFSAEREISDLNRADDNTFTFLMNINGNDTVYIMDSQSGNLSRMSLVIPSINKPRVSGRFIYFFSFFKSRYRLFKYEYNI